MRNGNDFCILLVGVLCASTHWHLCRRSEPRRSDRNEAWSSQGKVTFLVSPGRPLGHKPRRTVFSGRHVTIGPQVEKVRGCQMGA